MRVFVAGSRFIAQSFIGWNNTRSGGRVKTEEDPLDPHPLAGTTKSLAAIRHLEDSVLKAVTDGLILRYGILYGHGASDLMLEAVRKGFPAWAKAFTSGKVA
jgi:2-alkyl-3-oxoalkanoate reductase